MKVDNRMCKAFIEDLESCTKWNNRLGEMSEEDYEHAMGHIQGLAYIYSNIPDIVKSKDHVEKAQ